MLLSVVGKYIVILGSLSLSLYAFVAQLLIKIGIYYNTFWKQGQVWRVLYWPLMKGIMTYRQCQTPLHGLDTVRHLYVADTVNSLY